MKIWIVKHKGANIWSNLDFSDVTVSKGGKVIKQYHQGAFFLFKRDAEYVRGTLPYPDFYEVLGIELPKSTQDNRKK